MANPIFMVDATDGHTTEPAPTKKEGADWQVLFVGDSTTILHGEKPEGSGKRTKRPMAVRSRTCTTCAVARGRGSSATAGEA